jgi:UDP-N-acetylmuramoyl-L-alanyl-D-glutamate--2,6-diaminopimelate ligase
MEGMNFRELLSNLDGASIAWGSGASVTYAERSVSKVCFDSRELAPDCVFVAVRGGKVDGHQFLADAIAKGAQALVVENELAVPAGFVGAVVKVANSREALNRLASVFFGEPAKRLFCVGITGTNGKTTTAHVVEAILTAHGWPTGVIGTIDHHLGAKAWKTEMTTPDPVSFQQRLSEFVDLGAKALSMEVSSHALHQNRVDEVPFDVALFTNLSRDHLDYHSDLEDYFRAKEKLFTQLLAHSRKPMRLAVVNGDDAHGQRLAKLPGGVRVWTYGSASGRDLRFEVLEQGFGGSRFRLDSPAGRHEFHIPMPGLHNVYNASAAIGAGLGAGVEPAVCARALAGFNGVKGRLESVPNRQGYHVFVDYAHSDDAIRTVLHYLGEIRRASAIQNRIITVFGCGGDRDKGKRPLMMKAAESGSDLVVVTSDNPRTEDPEAIIRDTMAGADPALIGKKIFKETDRRGGIRKALELANPGDVILIAGKGHEDYQIIGTTRHAFSDVEAVKEILA